MNLFMKNICMCLLFSYSYIGIIDKKLMYESPAGRLVTCGTKVVYLLWQEVERTHSEQIKKVEREKMDLQEMLDEMIKQEEILSARVESLQADNDFTNEQLTNMKGT